MPTSDDHERLRAIDVVDVVEAAAFPATAPDADALGVEAEWFPIAPDGQTFRRRLFGGTGGVSDLIAHTPAMDGVHLQTEPGAQLEAATAPRGSVQGALDLLDRATESLSTTAEGFGVRLAAAGVDLWQQELPPLQSTAPRYPAMATYFAARGPAGARMMRHTCSLQLNFDLGRGQTARERWELGLLVAPVALATFAASPDDVNGAKSGRALTWQALDPTRTGIPAAFVHHPEWTPARQLADAALRADVLLVRTAADEAVAGTPGWTFGDWLEGGHPDHGWPTASDLRYHLTTLFHEVRPRGWLELRTLDALGPSWRTAAIVLHAGLLLDATARHRVLDVLGPRRSMLTADLRRAAHLGVGDPSLCARAVETWSYALEGAHRLPGVGRAALRAAEQFLDAMTMRGRCPADDILEAHRATAAASLQLVAEPLPRVTSRS